MKNPDKYKNTILDDLIGPSGIKTDVQVKIPPQTIIISVLIILVGVSAGILIAGAIGKAIKK